MPGIRAAPNLVKWVIPYTLYGRPMSIFRSIIGVFFLKLTGRQMPVITSKSVCVRIISLLLELSVIAFNRCDHFRQQWLGLNKCKGTTKTKYILNIRPLTAAPNFIRFGVVRIPGITSYSITTTLWIDYQNESSMIELRTNITNKVMCTPGKGWKSCLPQAPVYPGQQQRLNPGTHWYVSRQGHKRVTPRNQDYIL